MADLLMDDKRSKAFDFAADVAKQFLTLSTAILALTITFARELDAAHEGNASVLLGVSWVLYLVSILFGMWTLMALTGELEQVGNNRHPSTRGFNVAFPALAQIGLFLVATSLVTAYGWGSIAG